MKLTVLADNNTFIDMYYLGEPAVSYYIEDGEAKLLFDAGYSDVYLKNAEALGISLKDLDAVVISHGHNDHAGGLEAFLKRNAKAAVYAHRLAFLPHYSLHGEVLADISADAGLPAAYPGRIRLTEGVLPVDGELTLFSDVAGSELVTGANGTLFEGTADGGTVPDRFFHEQDLLIREGDKLVLAAGCAHRGIGPRRKGAGRGDRRLPPDEPRPAPGRAGTPDPGGGRGPGGVPRPLLHGPLHRRGTLRDLEGAAGRPAGSHVLRKSDGDLRISEKPAGPQLRPCRRSFSAASLRE